MSNPLQLTPAEIQYERAHINDTRAPLIDRVSAALIVVSVVAVGLRFWARWVRRLPLKADDWWMMPALTFELVLCMGNFLCAHYGQGRHRLALNIDNSQVILKLNWYIAIAYLIVHFFLKLSILYLYRRLFKVNNRGFRITWWAIFVSNICSTLVFCFQRIFMCWPVDYFWRRLDMTVSGHCSSTIYGVLLSSNIVSSCLDVALLVLPLTVLRTLQISKRLKYELSCIFGIGILATVAGFFRIWTVKIANNSTDASWYGSELIIWTAVEPCIGIFTANFPVFYPALIKTPFVRRWLPRLVGGTLGGRRDDEVLPAASYRSIGKSPGGASGVYTGHGRGGSFGYGYSVTGNATSGNGNGNSGKKGATVGLSRIIWTGPGSTLMTFNTDKSDLTRNFSGATDMEDLSPKRTRGPSFENFKNDKEISSSRDMPPQKWSDDPTSQFTIPSPPQYPLPIADMLSPGGRRRSEGAIGGTTGMSRKNFRSARTLSQQAHRNEEKDREEHEPLGFKQQGHHHHQHHHFRHLPHIPFTDVRHNNSNYENDSRHKHHHHNPGRSRKASVTLTSQRSRTGNMSHDTDVLTSSRARPSFDDDYGTSDVRSQLEPGVSNKIYHGRGSRDMEVDDMDGEAVPLGEISVKTDMVWTAERI
ncbi:hypothetical protein MMC25_003963 [Agyrium rufum]|nr:hypothetical protein [Agyrium rufum]